MQKDGTPDRLLELSPKVRKFLAGMRDEEVEALEVVVKQNPARLEALLEFIDNLRKFGRFTKWVVVTIVGTFIGTMVFVEYIVKAWNLLRGPNP